ncbi:MAG: hypothetical protein IK093_08955 [Ruminiclostridium sp.]|nr:hypothetical protein [Ruminiclostridium sp.]
MDNIYEILNQSQSTINRISAEAKLHIEEEENRAARSVSKVLIDNKCLSDIWTEEQLSCDGQYKRLINSMDKHIKIVRHDRQTDMWIVQGSSSYYEVTSSGCTCSDFACRTLPCKHMYYLAIARYTSNNEPPIAKTKIQLPNPAIIDKNDNCTVSTFVISGGDSTYRWKLKERIEQLGNKVAGSVSKKTSYLVSLDNAQNTKIERARELNIPIINEDELMSIIEKKEIE